MNFIKKNLLTIFAIIYVFFPADILPDALPLLGSIDDTIVLLLDLFKRYVQSRKEQEANKDS